MMYDALRGTPLDPVAAFLGSILEYLARGLRP